MQPLYTIIHDSRFTSYLTVHISHLTSHTIHNVAPMQLQLTEEPYPQHIPLTGGELLLIRNWLAPDAAEALFSRLRASTAWEQSTIRIAGKPVRIPRLNAWYGDEGRGYTYSGTRFEARPWTDDLADVKAAVQETVDEHCPGLGFRINSALLNLYRDGNDSVGWHSDNERELGPEPQIASLSLGAARRFVLKDRRDRSSTFELTLGSGTLLLMLGATQRHWLHAVPKTRRSVGERVNVTFRQIF